MQFGLVQAAPNLQGIGDACVFGACDGVGGGACSTIRTSELWK